MDIEEKCRSDLIKRFRQAEEKEHKRATGLSKTLKSYLLDQDNKIVVKPELFAKPQAVTRPKKAAKPLEEDEYFDKIEEIVKRDYYPDLVKMEKLMEYEEKLAQQANGELSAVDVPSVLLKSTGKSGITIKHGSKDQVDSLINKKRSELGLTS